LIVLKKSTPYNLDDMINDPEINLEKKKINNLDVTFESYVEMFDAMNLTNEIKKIFKDKSSINGDTSPFHINTITRNIQFNDKDRWDIINENE
jgi:hypothetical protein